VKDKDLVSVFSCGYPVFPAEFVEEDVFSPLCVLGSFVQDQLAIDVQSYVWIFFSDQLFLLFLCRSYAVFIVMAL
jgi:hypothetical protein